MPRKILIDTNVLLDAAMSERPGWAAANLVLDDVVCGAAKGYVASLSLKDVYYILTKYLGECDARAYVEAMLDLFCIIAVDEALCRLAIRSDEPDFEDGIVRACAEAAHMHFIISRDKKAFRTSPIKCLSAQDYVDCFCKVEEVCL